MAEVRLQIANREYIVTCQDGEESRLIQLGGMVDAKVQETGGNASGLNESRQLLFAALLLADEASVSKEEQEDQSNDASKTTATNDVATNDVATDDVATDDDVSRHIEMAAISIEKLADRVESFAEALEQFNN